MESSGHSRTCYADHAYLNLEKLKVKEVSCEANKFGFFFNFIVLFFYYIFIIY